MPKLVVLGEIALDHVGGTWRLGGASYAARAAAPAGISVTLAGPLASDAPSSEIARLERLGITISSRADGISTRYVMLGTGPGENRSTITVPGTTLPAIIDESGDAYLIFAAPSLDPDAALAAARRNSALVALDGHSDEIRSTRWRSALRDVDCLLLNLDDAKYLGDGDALAAAQRLGRTARTTVLKHGRGGLTVLLGQSRHNIAAFDIVMRDKVGAGDTLVGAALARHLLGDPVERAFTYGAAAAAYHIETGNVPEPGHVEDMMAREAIYVAPERLDGLVYIASPFFTTTEQITLRRLERGLDAAGLRVASPSRDIGILRSGASADDARRYFDDDLAALDQSVAVVAQLDQDDTGTAWEIGYAYARKIPVIALRTDVRAGANNMLVHSAQIARDMDELLRLLFRLLAR